MAKAVEPKGVPVQEHDGLTCTGEAYKNAVKLTRARAALALNIPKQAKARPRSRAEETEGRLSSVVESILSGASATRSSLSAAPQIFDAVGGV